MTFRGNSMCSDNSWVTTKDGCKAGRQEFCSFFWKMEGVVGLHGDKMKKYWRFCSCGNIGEKTPFALAYWTVRDGIVFRTPRLGTGLQQNKWRGQEAIKHPVMWQIAMHYHLLSGVRTMHIFIGAWAKGRNRGECDSLDNRLTLLICSVFLNLILRS